MRDKRRTSQCSLTAKRFDRHELKSSVVKFIQKLSPGASVHAHQENTKSVEQLIHLFHALQVNRLEQQVLDNIQPDQNEIFVTRSLTLDVDWLRECTWITSAPGPVL